MLPQVRAPRSFTTENYDKIKVGMTINDARNILGTQGEDETPDPGVSLSGGGLMSSGGKPDNIYVFKAKDFKIVLTVKDGKIVQKSKVDSRAFYSPASSSTRPAQLLGDAKTNPSIQRQEQRFNPLHKAQTLGLDEERQHSQRAQAPQRGDPAA